MERRLPKPEWLVNEVKTRNAEMEKGAEKPSGKAPGEPDADEDEDDGGVSKAKPKAPKKATARVPKTEERWHGPAAPATHRRPR
jgi:hypothetical protein